MKIMNLLATGTLNPLFENIFEKAKSGKLIEGEIKLDDIPYLLIPDTYNIYFDNILITKYRKTSFALRKILFSILDTLSILQ